MIDENPPNSLSNRRKRGTGLSERTTVTLSPRAKSIITNLQLNLSAWVEKKLVREFGEDSLDDPLLLNLLAEREQVKQNMSYYTDKYDTLCLAIDERRKKIERDNAPIPAKPLVPPSGIPDGYPTEDEKKIHEFNLWLKTREKEAGNHE